MLGKIFSPLLAILFLLLAALACSFPTVGESLVELDLPTPAPTPAPDESDSSTATPPEAAILPAENLVITSQGMATSFGPSIDAFCQNPQPLTLTVHPDGTAELTTTGPSFIDHYNCTPGASTETWYVNGTVAAAETVTFTGCNFGGFTADGSMSYRGGVLSGEVTCSTKDGTQSVVLSVQ